MLPGRPEVRRVVARPRADDGVEVRPGRRDEAGGAVGRRRRAAGAGGAAAGEDLLHLPRAERVRPGQLVGEHRRVRGGEHALPDEPAGLLVVAVARAECGREADVHVRLRHADDARDAAKRVVVTPEELRLGRALVEEEVDLVDVEDVDGAGAVVRRAVLVLAPEAERGADLGADGVAAALAARDHDDPAADAELLVPDAARADDARVVVRMGPLAHHVDLDRVVDGVRRWRHRASRRHCDRGCECDRRQDQAETSHVTPPLRLRRTSLKLPRFGSLAPGRWTLARRSAPCQATSGGIREDLSVADFRVVRA